MVPVQFWMSRLILFCCSCVQHGQRGQGRVSYVDGANIAGFVKVADAMLAQGVV